jgi:UDP-glucuronate 4-epimerase
MKYFITGTSGFIGFHVARRLILDGHQVCGFDGMTAYYDVSLKNARNQILKRSNAFSFVEAMLEDRMALDNAMCDFNPDIVIHLAAQAGVRYSIDHPETYISANLVGTFNLLESVRQLKPKHFLMASTSSVYGGNDAMPFRESERTDFPVSLYAATKKAGEAMSHSYAHLFNVPTTCFRFFTVYGPWGRPDMALFKFVSAIQAGKPIEIYGMGEMKRDFTYIDDLVEGIVRLVDVVPTPAHPVHAEGVVDSLSTVAPWRSVNIAGANPIGLLPFVEVIEQKLGIKAEKILLPMQQGDVKETYADAGLLKALTGFRPNIGIEEGVSAFVDWYQGYSVSAK